MKTLNVCKETHKAIAQYCLDNDMKLGQAANELILKGINSNVLTLKPETVAKLMNIQQAENCSLDETLEYLFLLYRQNGGAENDH